MFMKYLLSVFLELLGATAAVTTATAVPEVEVTGGAEDGGRVIYNDAIAYLIPLTSIPEAYSTLSNSV